MFRWKDTSVSGTSTGLFEIPVCYMASGYHLKLPIHVVTGNRPGPVVLVCAGSHGEELWSTEFLRRIKIHLLRTEHDFAGTILLAPVLNPHSLESGHRNTPVDLHNLNRVFPGLPPGKGWFSDQLAYAIAEHLLPAADVIFDYHGGGPDTVIHYTYTTPQDTERGRRIHEIALASGAEVLWEHVESRGTLTNHGEQLGKLCIVPEIGGGGLITDDSYFDKGVADFLNMLRVIEVVDGTPHGPRPRIVVKRGGTVRPTNGGTFVPVVGLEVLGKTVEQGTVLGNVVSPYTFEVLDEIVAPYPKTEVIQVRNRISKVHPGEYAYIVGDGDTGYAP